MMFTDEKVNVDTEVKATVYYVGEFGGFQKIEGRLYAYGRKKYAQYNRAAFVHIKPKRKRKVWGITQGYNPTIVIVEGWGHPEVREVGTVASTDSNGTTITAFGTMFSEERASSYNNFINDLIDSATLISDFREVK